ncbi:MAG: hypothetical protein AAF696_07530 [Bacteroidota bacterium]
MLAFLPLTNFPILSLQLLRCVFRKLFKSAISLCLFLNFSSISAQVEPAGQWAAPEWEASYFGEMLYHPGLMVGANFPFTRFSVAKEKSSKRRGDYFVERKRQYVIGTNLGMYFQPENHQGYLLNGEFGYRSLKTKSYKPEKNSFWQIDVGVGLYYYDLNGSTFILGDSGFEEIKGDGFAFMPSLSYSWGRSLRIGEFKVIWFSKLSTAVEIPFNIGTQPHLIYQTGFILPIKKTRVKK